MCYTVSDTSWPFHVVSWAVLCYLQRQPAFYCSLRLDMVECGRKGVIVCSLILWKKVQI